MVVRRAAAAVVVLVLAGCGGSSHSGATDKPPAVVPAASWTAISVAAAGGSSPAGPPAEVPVDARQNLVPLLASRLFDRPAPLAEYGLDHPQATLTYRSATGETAIVDVGQLNFDRHFVYAQRTGQPGVYLVPADTLRPVLALVGIDLQPPE